jgi:hypothetical protein
MTVGYSLRAMWGLIEIIEFAMKVSGRHKAVLPYPQSIKSGLKFPL